MRLGQGAALGLDPFDGAECGIKQAPRPRPLSLGGTEKHNKARCSTAADAPEGRKRTQNYIQKLYFEKRQSQYCRGLDWTVGRRLLMVGRLYNLG